MVSADCSFEMVILNLSAPPSSTVVGPELAIETVGKLEEVFDEFLLSSLLLLGMIFPNCV